MRYAINMDSVSDQEKQNFVNEFEIIVSLYPETDVQIGDVFEPLDFTNHLPEAEITFREGFNRDRLEGTSPVARVTLGNKINCICFEPEMF